MPERVPRVGPPVPEAGVSCRAVSAALMTASLSEQPRRRPRTRNSSWGRGSRAVLRWSATASVSGRRWRRCRIAYASSNATAPRAAGAATTRAQSGRSSSPPCAAARSKVVRSRSRRLDRSGFCFQPALACGPSALQQIVVRLRTCVWSPFRSCAPTRPRGREQSPHRAGAEPPV